MTVFVSNRERRLWIWVLIVVLAIYSTLVLSNRWAEALQNHGLFGVWFFLLGCLLVLATIITQGLKVRPGGREIFISLGIAAAYLLVFVRMSIPTERSHLIEYGVLAILIYEALKERATVHTVPVPALLAFLLTIGFGTLDECIQAFIPDRVFDYRDILFNILAAFMAISSSILLTRARNKVFSQ